MLSNQQLVPIFSRLGCQAMSSWCPDSSLWCPALRGVVPISQQPVRSTECSALSSSMPAAPCQPSGLQTTAGRPQAALPPACSPQRFKYLLTTWRVPNIYIGWGPPAQIPPPIGSLPLPPRRPTRWEERRVLGGGVITYRHNKLKLKPVCHRLGSLFIFN